MKKPEERKGAEPAPTEGGKAVEVCQRQRQICQQLSLIIEIIQKPRKGSSCSCRIPMAVRAFEEAEDTTKDESMELETELNEQRELIREMLRVVQRSADNRIGEGFLKDFARIIGRVSGLPSGPKNKTEEEISVLVDDMTRLLDDYDYAAILPEKGDDFDPKLHVPIEVKGDAEGARQIENVFRPGIKEASGRVVLHARVGLKVKSSLKKMEKQKNEK